MLGGAFRGFLSTELLDSLQYLHVMSIAVQAQAAFTNSIFSTLTSLATSSYTYTVAWAPRDTLAQMLPEQCTSGEGTQSALNRTLPASMSINTKLGRVFFVTLLNAPVADPGFIRKRSSSFDACSRSEGCLSVPGDTGQLSLAADTALQYVQWAIARLELVRVAGDKYVDVQLALQKTQRVCIAPGHYLQAAAKFRHTWGSQSHGAAIRHSQTSHMTAVLPVLLSTQAHLVPMAEPNLKAAQAEHLHAPYAAQVSTCPP